MPRIPNTHGGGALTNAHGLLFEQTTSLNAALINNGYSIKSHGEVCDSEGNVLGYSKSKKKFLHFLEKHGADLTVNSDELRPDDAFININNSTVYIIEKKFQSCRGSVDEKLQTCLYKKKQYNKLVSQLGYEIEYIYVLNDWFYQPKYKDVLEFIEEIGCHYFFKELPIHFLGL